MSNMSIYVGDIEIYIIDQIFVIDNTDFLSRFAGNVDYFIWSVKQISNYIMRDYNLATH